MADLERIKNNVAKMVAMNAPESDIDGYIASEGVTIDDVRNYQPTSSNILGAVTEVDKGGTGGFGRKLGALLNAVGASPVDALLTDKSLGEAFSDRYNEIVDPALKASEKFEDANPKTALALNIAGAVASPLNKVGANYIMKGAGTAGKLLRSGVVGAGSGAAYGAGRTENIEDLGANIAEDAQMGGVLGVVAPLAIQGVKNTVSKLRPQNLLANKATGLNNIAKDTESMKLLKRGIQADDAIANQVKEEAPAALNNLNEKMRESLNKLTGRKLDIAQANVNQQNRYNEFIGKNADSELLNFAPTREQIKTYPAESKFNLPKNSISSDKAQDLLINRANKSGVEIDGTLEHYTSNSGRRDTARTLSNTLDNPDIEFSIGNKGYVVKKYDIDGKSKFDFITKKDGKLYNKFIPKELGYVDNQIKNSTNGASISARVTDDYGRPMHEHITSTIDSVPRQKVVVNNNLPRLSAYTEGLDAFQKDALEQALNKGAYMSTNAKGTLGATHRGQEVLNDMIEASYDTSVIGQKKPTTETRQLMQVKERLNKILEPSGVKPYDTSLSKAKSLQDNFEKGYKFNPSETKFEALGLSKARDKRAFLQGRIAKILDNVKDDKNIAKAIQNDENTLRKLMSDTNYKKLLKDANSISTEYERIKNLSLQAEKQLVKPDAVGRPFSERAETRGAMLGSLIDKLNQIVMTDSNRRAANILLGNEKAINSKLFNAFNRIPDYSSTPYLVDILSQNK